MFQFILWRLINAGIIIFMLVKPEEQEMNLYRERIEIMKQFTSFFHKLQLTIAIHLQNLKRVCYIRFHYQEGLLH